MSKLTQSVLRILLTFSILFTGLASTVGTGYAQGGGISITGAADGTCGDITFTFSWGEGTPPYLISLDYGNEDYSGHILVDDNTFTIDYSYLDQGDYAWSFHVEEVTLVEDEPIPTGLNGSFSEILTLEGPEVTLSSIPEVPLFVAGDPGTVEFSTVVTGDDLTYEWDLDGDGFFDDGETGVSASFAYTEVGKYYPKVLVTDSCDFTASDTMPVLVANPGDACHPMAQKISDGVNTIFPDQSNDLYTCEDIYALFDNKSEENNLGFGLMWKAYNLAESMDVLTWEDIMDWKLNESGWGVLLQLDRFADLLDEDHNLVELMGLVMSEDFSLGDVRLAVRSVTRYEADFDDALTRIEEGANPGELGQFYKLAADLGADSALLLDEYLAKGMTLSELKHTSKFADQMEVVWTEVADARGGEDSWGDLGQAYRLATDEISAAEILIKGVQEYKESLREDDKVARELLRGEDKVAREEKQTSRTEETAEKLAEQFTAKFEEVIALFNGEECKGNWGCVRKALRDQEQEMAEGDSERDIQTAKQIGAKYGYSDVEVLAHHNEFCDPDWACTRTYFREHTLIIKETGKPD